MGALLQPMQRIFVTFRKNGKYFNLQTTYPLDKIA